MLSFLRTTPAVLLSALVLVPSAEAWAWPASGSVLRQFSLGDDPYAGGQHRGIDVAGEPGEPVLAPRAGTIAFAGSTPGNGLSLTIETGDGYSVTLVHLGSITVKRNAEVSEGGSVGTLGPSGDAEWPKPYLHLGVRLTADENGYVDPLGFLPSRPEPKEPDSPAPAPVREPEPTEPAPAPAASAPAETQQAPDPSPSAPAAKPSTQDAPVVAPTVQEPSEPTATPTQSEPQPTAAPEPTVVETPVGEPATTSFSEPEPDVSQPDPGLIVRARTQPRAQRNLERRRNLVRGGPP